MPSRKPPNTSCKTCRRHHKRCDHRVRNRLEPQREVSNDSGIYDVPSTFQSARHTPGKFTTQNRLRGSNIYVISDDVGSNSQTPHFIRDSYVFESPSIKASSTNNSPETNRFIGALNPESVLHGAHSPAVTERSNESIGVWVDPDQSESIHEQQDTAPKAPRISLLFEYSAVSEQAVPSLRSDCMRNQLSKSDSSGLTSLYFTKVHPLFPLVDEVNFRSLPTESCDKLFLQHGIWLVASMDPAAEKHLIFTEQNQQVPLSHQEFGRRLLGAMRMAVEIDLVKDRAILAQGFGLMSFFMDRPVGKELSSMMCSMAVHYVHSLGLHIQRRDEGHANNHSITLLCCIWALDRLNAAFQGRPVLMHERDMSQDMEQCINMQKPCFRLFLRVIMLLDKVINAYRPRFNAVEASEQQDLGTFQDLITSCDAQEVPAPFLATIEVLHNSVVILLASRLNSLQSLSQPSALQLRQEMSAAMSITSTVSEEFGNKLTLLPFIPYAVSLSMSVAYRQMRHSKVQYYLERSRGDFVRNRNLLNRLGEVFWAATAMANVGSLALIDFDRLSSAAMKPQIQNDQHAGDLAEQSNNSGLSVNLRGPRQADLQGTEDGAAAGINTTLGPNPAGFDEMSTNEAFEMLDQYFFLDGINASLELDLEFSSDGL